MGKRALYVGNNKNKFGLFQLQVKVLGYPCHKLGYQINTLF